MCIMHFSACQHHHHFVAATCGRRFITLLDGAGAAAGADAICNGSNEYARFIRGLCDELCAIST